MKILIVEDEFTSRKTLSSFLLPFGDIDIAVNGNEALAAVEKAVENKQLYELIFLDIMLHELDGFMTLEKIREIETRKGVKEHDKSKIIITSANTDKDVILKAARAGCTSYMVKPIDKTRLWNEIRKHGFDIPEHSLTFGVLDNG